MPILDADLSQIEWRSAAYLSQDPVMIQEIVDGMDMHSFARDTWMKLPPTKENRQHAKIFNFRAIYRGHPYGFYMDSKMPNFSYKKWKEIYAAFYKKYATLYSIQEEWIQEVARNKGWMLSATGRILRFTADEQGLYPESSICNYPVSSVGTVDIIGLAMLLVHEQVLKECGPEPKLIMQVHDSIIYDLPQKHVDSVARICKDVFIGLPASIDQTFKMKQQWNVPLDGDIAVGPSWGAVEEVNF